MTRRHGRPQRPWHGPCRHGCGQQVAAFVDENGLAQQLETTATGAGEGRRVFQDKGPRIGWVSCQFPQHATGTVRAEHVCPEAGSDTTTREDTTMTDAFASLDDGSSENTDRFRPADHDGELLLLECSALMEGVATNYGHKDAVQCSRVVVLDGSQAGQTYQNVRLFNTVLVSQLTTAAKGGRPAVGRMGQGAAGSSGRAPWKLTPATEDEKDTAQQFLDGKADLAAARGQDAGNGDVPF